MRWNICGTYWHSDAFERQLSRTIYYYLSGQRSIDTTTGHHVFSIEIGLKRSVTRAEYSEIRQSVELSMKEFFSQRMTADEMKQQHDELMLAYQKGISGDVESAYSIWGFLEDEDRLKLTLHCWELCRSGKLDNRVWATILKNTWQRGKASCLLLWAKLSPATVVQMFASASKDILMDENFGTTTEFAVFERLPDSLVVWRGVSSNSKYLANGFSWSLDRNQACWFAYRNSSRAIGAPVLVQATVAREAVLALFGYEQEIVVNPEGPSLLSDVSVIELPKDSDEGELIRRYADLRCVDSELVDSI